MKYAPVPSQALGIIDQMSNYTFQNLSGAEFELLARDLLQEELGIFIESFTTGRDGGIDLRFSKDKNNTIVQCKRYTKLSDLKTKLKSEKDNLQELSPDRYILFTSVGLTPLNKEEIQEIFKPFEIPSTDILGRDDINALLSRYEKVEKRHHKLWLSSTHILDRIQNSKTYNQTTFEEDIIKKNIKLYVQNDSYTEALDILSKERFVMISGIPGIGKSTLARILVYNLLADGANEFIFLSENIGEAYSLLSKDKKQVFLFDDFLGKRNFFKNNFSTNEDRRIIEFINKVRESKHAYLIFTTREYILNQAKIEFENLNELEDNIKCVIDLEKYNKLDRSKILYNHLFFSNLPIEYINSLLQEGRFITLIDHKNYNPRIIESVLKNSVWKSISPEDFYDKFHGFFDNPTQVWKHAYENQISEFSKCLLAILMTTDAPIFMNDLNSAIQRFAQTHNQKYDIKYSQFEFEKSLKELEDCFIITNKDTNNQYIVNFQNPSILDFLIQYFQDKTTILADILGTAPFINQFNDNFTSTQSYKRKIQLNAELITTIVHRFVTDYEFLGYSSIHSYRDRKTGQIAYRKYRMSEIGKLRIIVTNIDYNSFPELQSLVHEKFLEIEPSDLEDSDEINTYIRILDASEKLLKEEIDITEKLEDLFTALYNLDDLHEFEELKYALPLEFDRILENSDFILKVESILKETISESDSYEIEDIQKEVERYGDEFNFSTDDLMYEIQDRVIKEQQKEAEYYMSREEREPSPISPKEPDINTEIINMFDSLK